MKEHKLTIILTIIILGFISTTVYFCSESKISKEEITKLEKELSNIKKENKSIKNELNRYKAASSSEYSNIHEITVSDLNKMINDKEDFILLISQTSCSHCISFKPILNKALKQEEIIGYELDVQKVSSSEKKEIFNKLDVSGTPTTQIYIDGKKQFDRILGVETEDNVIEFIRKFKSEK